MNKEAITTYPLIKEIRYRWSPRAFDDKEISKKEVKTLLEAARWAPSSMNEQPWRYILGFKGDESYDKILDCLVEFNRNWAQTAPVLGMVVGKKLFKSGKENRHFWYDSGQSMAYFSLQATAMNLHLHQMGGFSKSKAIEKLQIPSEEYEPLTAFALGYKTDPENTNIPDDLKEEEYNPRKRKQQSELFFEGAFGNSL